MESQQLECVFGNICKNGGVCYQNNEYFRCSCSAGYSGLLCEVVASNFCSSSPCKNGGTCNSKSSTCSCASNFKGRFCQVGLICDPDPCQSDQICLNIDGVPKCY